MLLDAIERKGMEQWSSIFPKPPNKNGEQHGRPMDRLTNQQSESSMSP